MKTNYFTAELFALVLSIVLLAGCTQAPLGKGERKASPFEQPFLKSLEAGKGAKNYIYSYAESYNGQSTQVTLARDGKNSMVEFDSPLTTKKIYFIENETVVCINELGRGENCVPAENDSAVASYLKSVSLFLLDDASMEKNAISNRALIEKGAIEFQAGSQQKTVNGMACSQFSYLINYSVLSVGDAQALGISSGAPREILATICVNSQNLAVEKSFAYSFGGVENTNYFTILKADFTSREKIIRPENVSNSTTALSLLLSEQSLIQKLAECNIMAGDTDRDRCVFGLALELNHLKLCEVAGTKRETCMLNFAVSRNKKEICDSIATDGFKEDCYLELAGINRDSGYCSLIANSSKKAQCSSVSTVKANGTSTKG